MKAAILFSGGKDSCLALHKALQKGYDIKYLLTIIPENQESFMFHKPYLELLAKQAEMLGIDLIVLGSEGEKEKELEDLEKLIELVKDKVSTIIIGGIASNYQSSRVKKICDKLNLSFFAPLWNYDPEDIWKDLFDFGFKIILVKIACEGLSKEFLGKIITRDDFSKIKKLSDKYKFRIDFEGGEAETAVVWMPEFSREIKIKFIPIYEGEYNAALNLIEIK